MPDLRDKAVALATQHGLVGPLEDREHQTVWESDLYSAAQNQVRTVDDLGSHAANLKRVIEAIETLVADQEALSDELLRGLGGQLAGLMRAACCYDASLREMAIAGEHYRLHRQGAGR